MQLSAFAGAWQIERRIEDFHRPSAGLFRGEAWFRPATGGLAYREEGFLSLDGGPAMHSGRSLQWREGQGGEIEVLFGDGRPFHRFDGGAAAPEATHDCPPDRYAVRYRFADWPVWQAEWRVSGPRKDYSSHSVYRPAGQFG